MSLQTSVTAVTGLLHASAATHNTLEQEVDNLTASFLVTFGYPEAGMASAEEAAEAACARIDEEAAARAAASMEAAARAAAGMAMQLAAAQAVQAARRAACTAKEVLRHETEQAVQVLGVMRRERGRVVYGCQAMAPSEALAAAREAATRARRNGVGIGDAVEAVKVAEAAMAPVNVTGAGVAPECCASHRLQWERKAVAAAQESLDSWIDDTFHSGVPAPVDPQMRKAMFQHVEAGLRARRNEARKRERNLRMEVEKLVRFVREEEAIFHAAEVALEKASMAYQEAMKPGSTSLPNVVRIAPPRPPAKAGEVRGPSGPRTAAPAPARKAPKVPKVARERAMRAPGGRNAMKAAGAAHAAAKAEAKAAAEGRAAHAAALKSATIKAMVDDARNRFIDYTAEKGLAVLRQARADVWCGLGVGAHAERSEVCFRAWLLNAERGRDDYGNVFYDPDMAAWGLIGNFR